MSADPRQVNNVLKTFADIALGKTPPRYQENLTGMLALDRDRLTCNKITFARIIGPGVVGVGVPEEAERMEKWIHYSLVRYIRRVRNEVAAHGVEIVDQLPEDEKTDIKIKGPEFYTSSDRLETPFEFRGQQYSVYKASGDHKVISGRPHVQWVLTCNNKEERRDHIPAAWNAVTVVERFKELLVESMASPGRRGIKALEV